MEMATKLKKRNFKIKNKYKKRPSPKSTSAILEKQIVKLLALFYKESFEILKINLMNYSINTKFVFGEREKLIEKLKHEIMQDYYRFSDSNGRYLFKINNRLTDKYSSKIERHFRQVFATFKP